MKTLLKVIVGIVAVVVVLVGAAALLLPQFIDADSLKAQAVARVKEHTGRELRIPGEVSMSVFPTLGLDVGEVELGNAPGFDGDTFARLDRLTVSLQLMPLLSREVVMDAVVLHGLTVNLARDADGNGNWEDLAGRSADEGGNTATPSGGDGGPGTDGTGLAALSIGGLDVRDASLAFDDRQAGETYRLDNLSVQTGPVLLGKPVKLELSFDLAGGKPVMQGRVELAGTLVADPDTQRFDVSGLDVSTDLSGESLPAGKLVATMGGDISADLGAQTLSVSDLSLETLGLTASGELQVSELLAATPSFEGTLALASFNPRELIAALGADAPQTTDSSALTQAEASFSFTGTPAAIRVQPLQARLDDTTLSGTLEVSDVARQALRFELQADAIDLDRYLPPAAEGGEATVSTSAGGSAGGSVTPAAGTGEPDLAPLRALDIDGTLALGSLTLMNLTVTDISVPVKAEGGVLRLSPMAAKLYEGSYTGNVTVDARGEQPKITVDETLAGVQAGPLLDDLQGEGKLEGTADVSARLGFTGTQPDAVKRSLNGDVAFSFTDGAIRGINIAQMIRSALAKLGGGAEEVDATRSTDFAALTGSATITDGVVRNDDLALKSPLLRVTGQGSADLPQDTVDYRVTTTLVATSQGQGGKDLEQLAGVPVPIRVSGSLAAPSFSPDLEALALALARSSAGDMVEAQKEQVKEKLQESLGGALGGALGGDDAAGAPGEDAVNQLKGLFGN